MWKLGVEFLMIQGQSQARLVASSSLIFPNLDVWLNKRMRGYYACLEDDRYGNS